jgi:maleate cis-trans isomerase
MAIRTRIGVMVPSTNTSCEADFQMVAPEGVTIHGHRMWTTNDAEGGESMEVMNADIETAAKYLSTAKVEAIAYGCTTGSFYKGPGWDEEMVRLIESTAGVPAASTSAAVTEALHFFGAKKLSIATPYPDWNNQKLRDYMTAQGFEVLNLEGEPWASKAGNQGINDQDPEVIVDFASGVCRDEADALFCPCTAWRSMEAAAELEQRLGKPVVTAVQATVWRTFRKAGITRSISGNGRLLELMPSVDD